MNARLSNAQIIAANNAVTEMLKRKLPRKAQLKLLRMGEWFEPYIKPLGIVEQELREKASKTTGDDEAEFADKLNGEWNKLLAEEDDYENCPQFRASLLDDTTDDLGLPLRWLGKFFKDDVSKDD